MTFAAGTIKQG